MSVCFACSLYVVGNIFVGVQLDSMVAGRVLCLIEEQGGGFEKK